jgi:hypothetical protein
MPVAAERASDLVDEHIGIQRQPHGMVAAAVHDAIAHNQTTGLLIASDVAEIAIAFMVRECGVDYAIHTVNRALSAVIKRHNTPRDT